MATAQNRAPLWRLRDELSTIYPAATNFQLALLNTAPNQQAITAGAVSGTTITKTSHRFVVGQALTTNANLGTWLAGQVRYVVAATTNTFQVSTTPGGAAVSLTGATATISDLPLVNPIHLSPAQPALPAWDEPQSLAAVLAKELLSYDGLATRPQVQRAAAPVIDANANTVTVTLNRATLNNTTGSTNLSFDAVAVISGGTTAPGNTTGTLIGWAFLDAPVLLDQSGPKDFIYTVVRSGA